MDVIGAAAHGNLERLVALVEQDAGLLHATGYKGRTPLLWAADWGHLEVARYLLSHGASTSYRDHDGYTALHLACSSGRIQVVLLLLQRGADVSAVTQAGRTPLMSAASQYNAVRTYAASQDQNAVVRALLEHGGSDVDAADQSGLTACHWACMGGHTGVLKQLLEAGADPKVRDAQGRTARDDAVSRLRHECVRTLQEWDRADILRRARRVRDASSIPPSNTPQQSS